MADAGTQNGNIIIMNAANQIEASQKRLQGFTLLSSQGGWRNPDSLTSSTQVNQESRLYKA